jgi:hypothetical protein
MLLDRLLPLVTTRYSASAILVAHSLSYVTSSSLIAEAREGGGESRTLQVAFRKEAPWNT